MDRAQSRTGMGIVVRDHRRDVVATKNFTRTGIIDRKAGEALTSLQVERMCKELGGHAIIWEGDAKNVVEAKNSEIKCGNCFGHFVEGTR